MNKYIFRCFVIFVFTLQLSLTWASPPREGVASASPRSVIVKIYRDYAWETHSEKISDRKTLSEQPAVILKEFFTDRLAGLIERDQECSKKTKGICNLDFDPIFASQDPGVEQLKIYKADKNNSVKVEFRYPGNKSAIRVTFKMIKEAGWKIGDICYQDSRCLVDVLSRNS